MKESSKICRKRYRAARKLADDEYLANIVLFHSQQCGKVYESDSGRI